MRIVVALAALALSGCANYNPNALNDIGNSLLLLQAARPRPAMAPMPMPTTTQCRSFVFGNQIQTTCHQ